MDLSNPYFSKQLLTYIGNKRSLLPFLAEGFDFCKQRIGRPFKSFDGFAGSGAVSRLLKFYSSSLVVNDLEGYAQTINSCYLANELPDDFHKKSEHLNQQWKTFSSSGFVAKNYAPMNDQSIQPGERTFYTTRNAQFIDAVRTEIESWSDRQFYLAPLLVEASIHCNTSGVFKGFHKKNGIGHFGGKGENALKRILGDIQIHTPHLSPWDCDVHISKKNVLDITDSFDVVYYDPPYNQHPYGSNYFMLNFINEYRSDFEIQNGKSGIAKDWNRSDFNTRAAEEAMERLIAGTKASFILISYNNEGIIPIERFRAILEKRGKVALLEKEYQTFRGSRNLSGRTNKVVELLWILEVS